jgi:hypothetical protein
MSMRKGMVPSAPIARALKNYLEEHRIDAPTFVEFLDDYTRRHKIRPVTISNIHGLFSTKSKNTAFDCADTILCCIGKPGLWMGEELFEHYMNVDISEPKARTAQEIKVLERRANYRREARQKEAA